MKIIIKFLGVVAVLGTLTACPLMTREDIQQQDEEKQLRDQVSTIQKSKADNELRYGDLQSEIRSMNGRIDSQEHNQQVSQQNTRQEVESLKKIIETQNERIKTLEQHIDASEAKLMSAIQAAAAAPAPAVATSSEPAANPEAAAGATGKGKKELVLFNEAEALFAKKEYKKAIVRYQGYRDKNPKGPRNAEATYKIGICFAELGLKKDAKEFYQEAIDSYPGTPAAKKAKFRLSQLH